MKEIIGYKLVKPEYEAAVDKIGANATWGAIKNNRGYYCFVGNSTSIANFKEAKVLDLWFEPVYKEHKFEIGKWYEIHYPSMNRNYIIKYGKDLKNLNNIENKQYYSNGSFYSSMQFIREVEVKSEEIQKYLPKEHPDKILAFQIGKWYKSDMYNSPKWYYLKVNNIEGYTVYGEAVLNTGEYNESWFWDNPDTIAQALKLGPLTDLSEIQDSLPCNHVDKLQYGKYYTSFFNDKLWQIFIYNKHVDKDMISTLNYINTDAQAYFLNNTTTMLYKVGKYSIKLSTPDEIKWLDTCISAKQFASKEQVFKPKRWGVDTYVVALKENAVCVPDFKIGSIAIVVNQDKILFEDRTWSCGEEQEVKHKMVKWFATLKEAEAFAESLKPKFKVGDYATDDNGENIYIITKIDDKSIHSNSGRSKISLWRLATSKEITKHENNLLLEEAKKKFPVGCKFYPVSSSGGLSKSITTQQNECHLFFSEDKDYWIIGSANVYNPIEKRWAELVVDEKPNISINGYKGEFLINYVKFGCAEISKHLFIDLHNSLALKDIHDFGNKEVTSVTIGKGVFSKDQIREIAEYYLNKK